MQERNIDCHLFSKGPTFQRQEVNYTKIPIANILESCIVLYEDRNLFCELTSEFVVSNHLLFIVAHALYVHLLMAHANLVC